MEGHDREVFRLLQEPNNQMLQRAATEKQTGWTGASHSNPPATAPSPFVPLLVAHLVGLSTLLKFKDLNFFEKQCAGIQHNSSLNHFQGEILNKSKYLRINAL